MNTTNELIQITIMNTTENNKLIAEFMGDNSVELSIPFSYELGEELPTSGNICTLENAEDEVRQELDEDIVDGSDAFICLLEYHNDWNRLMKVVEKIESIILPDSTKEVICYRFDVKIKQQSCSIKDHYSGEKIVDFAGNTKGKRVVLYNAIVEFIKWYNQNKSLS